MIYRVNQMDVDLEQFQIFENGELKAVEPKVFDLIIFLIENRQRLVTRDELFEQVWKGRQVSDTTLSNHVKSARKVLGDDGEKQAVIKTIRGRGYQFIAPVYELSEKHGELPESKQRLNNEQQSKQAPNLELKKRLKSSVFITKTKLIFVLVCLSALFTVFVYDGFKKTPNVPTLLVVPFSVLTEQPDKWQPFADQTTRELIRGFRKISGINTIAPPSSFTFKQNKRRDHIKKQLPNVDYVVDGVVAEGQDGLIRITVELENLKTGKLIWDNDFDLVLDSANRFSLQGDVAKKVAATLKVVLMEKETQEIERLPTTNYVAYDLYVLGQHQLSLMTPQSVKRAIDYFIQATQLDPLFENAYIAKAKAYRVMMTMFEKPKDWLPKVISSAKEVLALNPQSAQVMSMLGLGYVHTWQWQDAWAMLNQAQQQDPNLALTELGFALYHSAMGNITEVKQALAKANALDPLNEEIADWGIWALTMTNQLDEAIVWGEEKIRLHPNNPYPMLGVSIAYYLHGDVEKSLLWANKGVELSQRAPLALVILAQAYAVSGESLKALNLIDEANAQGAYTCPYETAVVHGMLGNDNAMFEQLNLAIDYQSNCLIFTKHDPRFNRYKKDSRYLQLLKQVGLEQSAMNDYQG